VNDQSLISNSILMLDDLRDDLAGARDRAWSPTATDRLEAARRSIYDATVHLNRALAAETATAVGNAPRFIGVDLARPRATDLHASPDDRRLTALDTARHTRAGDARK